MSTSLARVEPVSSPSPESSSTANESATEAITVPAIVDQHADGMQARDVLGDLPPSEPGPEQPKKRGRGRPRKNPDAPPSQKSDDRSNARAAADAMAKAQREAAMLAAARTTCNITISGAVAIFGDEWAPESKEEADMLLFAVRDYYVARGVWTPPPEVVLIGAFAAYAIPRLKKPTTKERIGIIVSKIKAGFNR